jgi:hypothetical protein
VVTVKSDDSVVSALARIGWDCETDPSREGSRAHALAAPPTGGVGAPAGAQLSGHLCAECGGL